MRGKAITDNAKVHLSSNYLVTIDIKNFFPSVDPHQVRDVWRKILNCSPDVSYLLTGLTTCRRLEGSINYLRLFDIEKGQASWNDVGDAGGISMGSPAQEMSD